MSKSAPVVWVTGSGGFIGHTLVQRAGAPCFAGRILPWTRDRLALEDFQAVDRAFAADPPDGVIHCAALSRGPACEANPARAELLNVAVTRHLCELAAGIPFLFLSTDLVFDGRRGGYTEGDEVNPLSVYAETKARAEREVLRNPRHTVVRLAINVGTSPSGDRSFSEVMRNAWRRGETLTLFADEYRSPIPAAVTAQAIWELFRRERPGLYHLGGAERLSRHEIGRLLAKQWPNMTCRITKGSLLDHPGPPRPADVSLNCARLQSLLSFPLPRLSEWLAAQPPEQS